VRSFVAVGLAPKPDGTFAKFNGKFVEKGLFPVHLAPADSPSETEFTLADVIEAAEVEAVELPGDV
jgi:hypothetical protein